MLIMLAPPCKEYSRLKLRLGRALFAVSKGGVGVWEQPPSAMFWLEEANFQMLRDHRCTLLRVDACRFLQVMGFRLQRRKNPGPKPPLQSLIAGVKEQEVFPSTLHSEIFRTCNRHVHPGHERPGLQQPGGRVLYDPHQGVKVRNERVALHKPPRASSARGCIPCWPKPCRSAPETQCTHRMVGSNFDTMSRETTSALEGSAHRLGAAEISRSLGIFKEDYRHCCNDQENSRVHRTGLFSYG